MHDLVKNLKRHSNAKAYELKREHMMFVSSKVKYPLRHEYYKSSRSIRYKYYRMNLTRAELVEITGLSLTAIRFRLESMPIAEVIETPKQIPETVGRKRQRLFKQESTLWVAEDKKFVVDNMVLSISKLSSMLDREPFSIAYFIRRKGIKRFEQFFINRRRKVLT